MHGEFKLLGENFRNGSAAFRFNGGNRKGASTTYEVRVSVLMHAWRGQPNAPGCR